MLNQILILLNHDKLNQHKQAHVYDAKVPYFPTGRLDAIIDEVKKKRKIDANISKKFVRKRICRNKITVVTPSGPDSPLASIEPKILQVILSMAEIREPLQSSRYIHLINDMIKDTPSQQKLVDFKNRMNISTNSPPGCIGPGRTFAPCMK